MTNERGLAARPSGVALLGPTLRRRGSLQRRRDCALPVRRPGPTDRQVEVLALVGQGLTAAEVGRRLGITEHTTKTHLRNLYETIGAKSAPHAVTLGYEQGWLRLAGDAVRLAVGDSKPSVQDPSVSVEETPQ